MYGLLSYAKKNKGVIIITLFFGIIYSLISLVNHYNFRTNAGDLGIYNQAIYDYAHFRFNYNTVWYGNRLSNILSDHFSLFQILISPLYWVFKSYTLLVVQIASILFGGVGIYKYIKLISKNEKLSLLALFHFYAIWGVYSALNFDYHDNVVATMFIPWIVLSLKKENYIKLVLFFTLLIISRENMIIWAIFLALGLLFVNFRDKTKRKWLLIMLLYSTSFLVLTFLYFMPSFTQEVEGYTHFSFSILGTSAKEAIFNIFQHPVDVLISLFTNHLNSIAGIGLKNEFFLTIILSGGLILLRKPQYLFILLPIFGQKLFHDTFTHWGISAHYSIEFAPILTIALFEYFSEHQNKHTLKIAFLVVVSTFTINYIKIEERLPIWETNVGLKFYAKEHYDTPYNVSEINKVLKTIPKEAVVSAESSLVPHLAARKYIYVFPRLGDAEYIALSPKDSVTFPVNLMEYELLIKRLDNSYLYKKLSNNDCFLYQKQKNATPTKPQVLKVVQNIYEDSVWVNYLSLDKGGGKTLQQKVDAYAKTILQQQNTFITRKLYTAENEKISELTFQIDVDRLVIIAVKDEATKKLSDSFKSTFDNKYKTHLTDLKFRGSYIAIFNKGELVYEAIDNKKIVFTSDFNNHFVEVASCGGDDFKNICAVIKINGTDFSLNKRGINVVSLDAFENIRAFNFDTFKVAY